MNDGRNDCKNFVKLGTLKQWVWQTWVSPGLGLNSQSSRHCEKVKPLLTVSHIPANWLLELYFCHSRGQYVSPSSRGQELFPHVSGMAYLALIAQPGTNSFAYLRGVSCFVGGEWGWVLAWWEASNKNAMLKSCFAMLNGIATPRFWSTLSSPYPKYSGGTTLVPHIWLL